MPNEIELKLRIARRDATLLRQHPAILSALAEPPVTHKLTSIYYDTPKLELLDADLSLRVRRMAGGWFQAVKSAGNATAGLHQRMEWEDIIAFGHPDFSKITDPELTHIFDNPDLRASLSPIFTTEVQRTEWQLAWENGDRIEVALDLGKLIAGTHREPISEVELELKAGSTERLFQLALALQKDIPLAIENISKAERGYAFYRPQPPTISRAHKTKLKRHIGSRDAFRQIGRECLAQLLGNQDMVIRGTDIEGIHQMRVALRRLRSAMGMFRDFLDADETADITSDLRWIADILGQARDLDVFITETIPPMVRNLDEHPGLLELREKARAENLSAYHAARKAISSPRYQRLLVKLAALTELAANGGADSKVQEFAKSILEKRYGQLVRHGKRLSKMQPEERHAVRIASKKLRYAMEFFSSLFDENETRDFLGHLSELQGILGDLNDIAVTDQLLRRLAGTRPAREVNESLFLFFGWNASKALHRKQHLQQAWKSFARCKPFWR